jgi:hypothetical protein
MSFAVPPSPLSPSPLPFPLLSGRALHSLQLYLLLLRRYRLSSVPTRCRHRFFTFFSYPVIVSLRRAISNNTQLADLFSARGVMLEESVVFYEQENKVIERREREENER